MKSKPLLLTSRATEPASDAGAAHRTATADTNSALVAAFDPNLHEARFEVPVPDKEPGTVVVVTKVGYKLHDRVIRPAEVGVVPEGAK